MPRFLILCVCLAGLSCKPKDVPVSENQEQTQDPIADSGMAEVPGLHHMWDSDKLLTTSESVCYDRVNNLLYVSCINGGPPDKKDGDGYIARLGLDGNIITLKWATGLSAPKGMGIAGQLLYVTDITRLVAIDITTGKTINTWNVNGARFLNDVATADDGTVYFSDSETSSIYALRGGTTIETVIDADATLGGVNGIYVDGQYLLFIGFRSGQVMRMDLATHHVEKIAEGMGSGDGIQKYNQGWLASNWNGEIYYIGSDREVMQVLDSKEAKLNTADIEVIKDKNMLLIPTFYGNTVSAYALVKQ